MTTYTKEKLQAMLARAKEELDAAGDRACSAKNTYNLMKDSSSYVAWREADDYAMDCVMFIFDIQEEIDSLNRTERN